MSRCESPICGAARPTPGASRIVSTMSSTKILRFLSNVVTGCALRRNTGSGSVTILRRVICWIYLCFSIHALRLRRNRMRLCSGQGSGIPDFTLISDFVSLHRENPANFYDRLPATPPCDPVRRRSPLLFSWHCVPYGGGRYPIERWQGPSHLQRQACCLPP